MDSARFEAITGCYADLRIAILGDFCLDRYLEIDPDKAETSLETGLVVHNVANVRAQPGAAGTILSNLSALGIGTIFPIGFAGQDGEGFELWSALERVPGVNMTHFIKTVQRRTFTYCKPLVKTPQKPPVELNRLDLKNWTPTPALVQGLIIGRLESVISEVDAMIVMDQVEVPDTGVIAQKVREALAGLTAAHPDLLVLADSRRSLRGFPPVTFKMNGAELAALSGARGELSPNEIDKLACALACQNRRDVFVTLGDRGILGASRQGIGHHAPAFPVRGPIDIVGAGDAVSANLTAALAAGATLPESLELANAAASVVIHKLGTTGTATVGEIGALAMKAE
jgi:rfaE bifunctional protein kinase chain/domain